MAPIVSTIDVGRPPEDVFAYATDPSRFHEWQKGVVSGRMEGGGAPAVGSKCVTTRRIGLAERPIMSEISQIAPPRGWAVHGLDGPIRATVNVTVEPLEENARSRLTIALDFEGHGIGKLLLPLVVRMEARKEMPANLRTLKDRLEARG